MTELKPCPFCGGDPRYFFGIIPYGQGGYYYSIRCDNCNIWITKELVACGITAKDVKRKLRKEAEEAWNTRNGGKQ